MSRSLTGDRPYESEHVLGTMTDLTYLQMLKGGLQCLSSERSSMNCMAARRLSIEHGRLWLPIWRKADRQSSSSSLCGRGAYHHASKHPKSAPIAPNPAPSMLSLSPRSTRWTGLTADAQRTRCPHIERFREQHGNKRVALLTRPHIEAIMALIPNICARRQWLQAIKPLLQAAVPLTLRVNPAERVRVKIPKTRGHHAWIGEEIARYRVYWPLGTQQRLAMEFAVEAVSRRSEVFRLGPQHIRNGRIRVDRVHGSKAVDIPVTPELHAACDATPKGQRLYVVNSRGRPCPEAWDRICKMGHRGRLAGELPLHGLNKGGMRRLTESGAAGHEIMAVSGHHRLSVVELYTGNANRKKLADSAMRKRIADERANPRRAVNGNPVENIDE
jgi:hypothetical protein